MLRVGDAVAAVLLEVAIDDGVDEDAVDLEVVVSSEGWSWREASLLGC